MSQTSQHHRRRAVGGSLGMHSEELERLDLHAAIAVFSQPDLMNGDELRFARKAMDQLQPALAALLDVSVLPGCLAKTR